MINKILDKIKDAKSIIIIGHVSPDGDCYGCQYGLKEIIKDSFKKDKVYVVGEPSTSLKFMGQMDNISDDVFRESLIVLVDVANEERIADKRYKLAKDIVKIDHHPYSDNIGSVVYVDTTVSSASEIIARIAIENNLVINEYAANSLLTGIITDSGGFRFSGVTAKTFAITSKLLECGADPIKLNKEIAMRTFNELKVKGYVIDNMKRTDLGFVYCYISKATRDEYNVSYEEASNAVDVLSNIVGCPVWALFLEVNEELRIRLRSNGPIINTLAKEYGGGGHPLASGCHLKNGTYEENIALIEKFAKDADRYITNYNKEEK